tara:strand:- start:111 stop:1154 length:1044 start_codon:yes stop_codon:yes gene_type:complete
MPRQNVEFEFPDPDKEEASQEVEIDIAEEEDAPLEVEGAVGSEAMKSAKDTTKAGEVEIEIEDDTPEADRGRKASPPPEEVTNEELENYSDKVKNRIKHFSKGYHDERRAKEAAQREREELESYAKNLMAENEKLKGSVDQSHNTLIESAKKQVQGEMALAQRQYKEAYESGEPDKILEAQTSLNTAQIRQEKVNGLKPKQIQALQPQETPVQPQVDVPQPRVQQDEKANSWRDDNPWFGSDDEMTAFALGLHNKLTKDGVDPKTDTYYEKINSRMRQVFPDQFDDGIEDEPEVETKSKSSNVVAPATRSTAPKKIRLTQSQVAIAKKLGVPLETYAKQAAELMRKQ